ncbi:MAG: hypothetical protein IPP44_17815 [Ideonella sp.]|nr:hypothetical protein [Ideonella sp.]
MRVSLIWARLAPPSRRALRYINACDVAHGGPTAALASRPLRVDLGGARVA